LQLQILSEKLRKKLFKWQLVTKQEEIQQITDISVWIRIGFNADPDPTLYLNADPDPDKPVRINAYPDPGQKTCQQRYKILFERQ
jgi:hypothetical protein